MRISKVVVINDVSVEFGGTTKLALLSVRRLRAKGIPVVYVTGDAGNNAELVELGVEIVAAGGAELLKLPFTKAVLSGLYNTTARAMVAKLIAERDDPGTVYHVHGWAQILSPSVFGALAPVAARCFIHAHDYFLSCPNGVFMDYQKHEVCERTPLSLSCLMCNCDKRSYLQKTWRIMRQISVSRMLDIRHPWAGIIALHPLMIPRLARAGYPESMFHVVRNPAPAFSETRIKAEDNKDLVFIGRLEEDKGVLYLAAAARRTGMRLICIGEGNSRKTLEKQFPEVVLTGWMSRDEIAPLLSGARAMVLSSLHSEPFGLVLPEAIESGLPVAVVETALLSKEIVDAGLGFSFNVFDDASFDAALIRLRDASEAEIKRISVLGHSRTTGLASTEEEWFEGLWALYQGVVPIAA